MRNALAYSPMAGASPTHRNATSPAAKPAIGSLIIDVPRISLTNQPKNSYNIAMNQYTPLKQSAGLPSPSIQNQTDEQFKRLSKILEEQSAAIKTLTDRLQPLLLPQTPPAAGESMPPKIALVLFAERIEEAGNHANHNTSILCSILDRLQL